MWNVSALGPTLEFDTTNADGSAVERLTDTRFVIVWSDFTATNIYVQSFDLNRTTGEITANDSPLALVGHAFNSYNSAATSIVRLSDTQFAVFWSGEGRDGYCRTFQVDGGGAVTAWGSQLEYDTDAAFATAAVLMHIDGSNARILNVWEGTNSDGFARIITVNMSTGAMTGTGTALEYDNQEGGKPAVVVLSSDKVLVTYSGLDSDLYAVVLSVNTTTWAVTIASGPVELHDGVTVGPSGMNALTLMSASPLIAVSAYDTGAFSGDRYYLQMLDIDDITWAVSPRGSRVYVHANGNVAGARNIARVDDENVLLVYRERGGGSDGFAAVYNADLIGNTLTAGTPLEYEPNTFNDFTLCDMGGNVYVSAFSGIDNDGFVVALQIVESPQNPGAFLQFF